jgi:hypothetical protein
VTLEQRLSGAVNSNIERSSEGHERSLAGDLDGCFAPEESQRDDP